jgi:hypothetical protein
MRVYRPVPTVTFLLRRVSLKTLESIGNSGRLGFGTFWKVWARFINVSQNWPGIKKIIVIQQCCGFGSGPASYLKVGSLSASASM